MERLIWVIIDVKLALLGVTNEIRCLANISESLMSLGDMRLLTS